MATPIPAKVVLSNEERSELERLVRAFTTGQQLALRGRIVLLAGAPREGAPAKFTPEQVCQIIALACEKPADSNRPISQWSHRELADEIVQRGIVASISPRHAGRLLKRGRS